MVKQINFHAKALSRKGASKGGKARALELTSVERSQIARKAVIARWAKEKGVPENLIAQSLDRPLKALNQGKIKVGALELNCAVLENQIRVISFRSFSNYLSAKGSGTHWKRKKEGEVVLPEFVSASFLEDFIDDDLRKTLTSSVSYISVSGQPAEGIEATAIPRICDVWIKALNAGRLDTTSRKETAQKAYRLLNAFANIGIIALIDEATGYQKQKDNYQKILEQYIAPEIRHWVKTFDDDYYKQLYRLIGWDWDAFKARKKNHSQYIGRLTNRIIYEKLAPGVLEALSALNPKNSKGNRSHRHHQNLSENFGYVRLIKHLSAVTTIMEQFDDGQLNAAVYKIDSRYPSLKLDYQMSFDFPIPMDNKKLSGPEKSNAHSL